MHYLGLLGLYECVGVLECSVYVLELCVGLLVGLIVGIAGVGFHLLSSLFHLFLNKDIRYLVELLRMLLLFDLTYDFKQITKI